MGCDFGNSVGLMRILAFIGVASAVAFAALPQCMAADRGALLQQELHSGKPLYKASPQELGLAVQHCVMRDPRHAGDYVSLVLLSGRNDADAIAPAIASSAIKGLGGNPHPDDIGSIVAAAVKATPSEVLDIVTAAIKVSPRSAAPAIVRAAVANVPDPESMVTVNFQRRAERIATSDKQDGKQTDHKEVSDGKSLAPETKQLTLAEAIIQAAIAADPGLSEEALTPAVDSGIASVEPPPPTTPVLPPVPPIPPGPGPGFGVPGTVSP
jgi:hypothetical protein